MAIIRKLLLVSRCWNPGRVFGWAIFLGVFWHVSGLQAELPVLKVSENKRFLVKADGEPFFWLGDTAWELFHRLDREQASRYLKDRQSKGFTVVQAVALAELNGLNSPNAAGHRPLIENDPARPAVQDGPENDYWDDVDAVIDEANALGMYVGFLPTWGDKWNKAWGEGPEVFTPENAAIYGEWLGSRYRDKGLIWILGGDRPIENSKQRAIIEAMAAGLKRGDGGKHLMTFHPPGGNGSSTWFHEAGWLDFNMRQNGHAVDFTGHYDATKVDFDRKPKKPVIDGEPLYEDHPIAFDPAKNGHSTAVDVRRPLYWDLFGGAFGHTYGHHSIWGFWDESRAPLNLPLMPWTAALNQPGAAQMQHAKDLLLSRPFLSRIPDDSVIVPDRVTTSVPGAGRYRFAGTRDSEGSFAMVYAPVPRRFQVRMDLIRGPKINAWWFNPRNGVAKAIGTFDNRAKREFMPPDAEEGQDWVLVLDDASRNFPPPGKPAGDAETANGRDWSGAR